MFRMIIIPLLALAGLAFAIQTVRTQAQERPMPKAVAEPAKSPFADSIAGSGILEASTRNIGVGTNIAGIVVEVNVDAGAKVKKGEPLFRIDDRTLRAELVSREATLEIARMQLAKLKQLPRAEDLPPAEARLATANAELESAKTVFELMNSVEDKRAVIREEWVKRQNAVLTATARVAEAKAALEQLKSGAWKADLMISQSQIQQAEAAAVATRTELERLVVRAPVDGEVLQCNIRVGEFAQAGPLSAALMLIGNTETMHVRVDIDENDAWRLKPGAKARVSLRGNPQILTDEAKFVRVEPYVIPKRSLTGDSTERVDTRVLQVIYAFPRGALNAFVGQQVDVRIDAPVLAVGGGGSPGGEMVK